MAIKPNNAILSTSVLGATLTSNGYIGTSHVDVEDELRWALYDMSQTLYKLGLDGTKNEHGIPVYHFTGKAIDRFLVRWPLMKQIAELRRMIDEIKR